MKEFKLEDLLGQPNGMMFECLECGEDLGENIADIEPTSDAVMVKTDVNETTSRIWWFCGPACAVKYIGDFLSHQTRFGRSFQLHSHHFSRVKVLPSGLCPSPMDLFAGYPLAKTQFDIQGLGFDTEDFRAESRQPHLEPLKDSFSREPTPRSPVFGTRHISSRHLLTPSFDFEAEKCIGFITHQIKDLEGVFSDKRDKRLSALPLVSREKIYG